MAFHVYCMSSSIREIVSKYLNVCWQSGTPLETINLTEVVTLVKGLQMLNGATSNKLLHRLRFYEGISGETMENISKDNKKWLSNVLARDGNMNLRSEVKWMTFAQLRCFIQFSLKIGNTVFSLFNWNEENRDEKLFFLTGVGEMLIYSLI